MFKRLPKTLTANLATSGTLKLGVLDKVALRDSGHRLFANGVRYNANTDFTIAVNAATGEATLTWLHATTLTAGMIILVAIAFIDSITSSDGSGGGGGDATAAKQDDQITLLTGIETALNTPATELPPQNTGGLNSAVTTVAVNKTTSGADTICAADADEAWQVSALILSISGATTLTLDSGGVDCIVDIPGAGILTLDPNQDGWNTGAVNTALTLTSSNAVTIKGNIQAQKGA